MSLHLPGPSSSSTGGTVACKAGAWRRQLTRRGTQLPQIAFEGSNVYLPNPLDSQPQRKRRGSRKGESGDEENDEGDNEEVAVGDIGGAEVAATGVSNASPAASVAPTVMSSASVQASSGAQEDLRTTPNTPGVPTATAGVPSAPVAHPSSQPPKPAVASMPTAPVASAKPTTPSQARAVRPSF